jgi:hypothetical protein
MSQPEVNPEFSMVGLFDDHEDGALRYAMLLDAQEKRDKRGDTTSSRVPPPSLSTSTDQNVVDGAKRIQAKL